MKKLGKKNLPHAWITAKQKPPGTYSLSVILNIIWMAGLIKTELWPHLVCITRSIIICLFRKLFWLQVSNSALFWVSLPNLTYFLDPLWQKAVMNKFGFFHFWSSKSKHYNLLYRVLNTLGFRETSQRKFPIISRLLEQIFVLADIIHQG